MKPLVGLLMMVRDEASSIRAVLEAAKPFVDGWCVLDTGSVDGTQDIVREVMAGVPGAFYEEPFVSYAISRNRALALAAWTPEAIDHYQKAACTGPLPTPPIDDDRPVFTLFLSGDEHLREGAALREYLETRRDSAVDAHKVRLKIDDETLCPPRVFRTGSEWHYADADCGVHEFPTHEDPKAPIGVVPGTWIDHVVSDPERRLSTIWERHIPLLEEALARNPENPRALVFLASSYEALFAGMAPHEQIKYGMEAMGLYLRRFALPFDTQVERNYLRYRYLSIARMTGVYSDAELLSRCVELTKEDPARPDTALLCAQVAMKVLPLTEVHKLACRAAQVAVDAAAIQSDSPVSLSCAWQAHHIAAVAARQLSLKLSDAEARAEFAGAVKQHVEMGIAAGGPPYVFNGVENPVDEMVM